MEKANHIQKIATPRYLLQTLEVMRVGQGDKETYLARDKFHGRVHSLEPWQFHVLKALPDCADFGQLNTDFEREFGQPLSQREFNEFIVDIANLGLLSQEAVAHPLLTRFASKTYAVEDGVAKRKPFTVIEGAAGVPGKEAPAAAPAATEAAPAPAAAALDPQPTRKMWVLFDPRPMLRLLRPVVSPLRYLLYALPLVVLAALMTAFNYGVELSDDVSGMLADLKVIEHLFFSLVTVNALVTLTVAVVAHHYRATVSAIGISLYMSVMPRLAVRISHEEQMTRGERMWLRASPLLLRLALASLGILVWHNARVSDGPVAHFALALVVTCAIGFVMSANPLVKGDGYHLLSAFLNEPQLRGKAYRALMNRVHGRVYQGSDSRVLAAYALASFAFAFVLIVLVGAILALALGQIDLNGSAIILASVLGVVLLSRLVSQFGKINAAYERSVQFDRWRNRTLATDPAVEVDTTEHGGWGSYAKRALPLTLLVVLFLPYQYEPGGNVTVLPDEQLQIATDISGIVEEVYYDGGETLAKGTPIARIAAVDDASKMKVYEAKIDEQKAIISELKSRPRAEEVEVASRALRVQQTRASFSRAKLERIQGMYKDGAIAFEEYEAARREAGIEQAQVEQLQAELDLVKAGAKPDEIVAAEARLKSIVEERDAYADNVRRATLVMPMDGNLLTLHLKDLKNSYLQQGQVFAAVGNNSAITAQIDVPETDIGFVEIKAPVRLKSSALSNKTFEGEVVQIDRTVTEQRFGNVIRVIAQIENPDGALRAGMTGYAKIQGEELPVWQAFSQAFLRFVRVQVWSWIP